MPDEMSIILSNELSNVAAQTTLDLQGLIASMRTSGMSDSAIKATLMSDLTSGGRLFGNYRNGVKNTVKSGIGRAGNIASEGRFFSAGVNEFRWVTASSKPCPDCERRHGETGTMEYWRTAGKPRSGFSVCQSSCQCQLLPEGYNGENLDKPLVRGKKKPLFNDIKQAETYLSKKLNMRDGQVSFKGMDMPAITETIKAIEEINNKTGLRFWDVRTVTKNKSWIAAYSPITNTLSINLRMARNQEVLRKKINDLDKKYQKQMITSEKTISESKEMLRRLRNRELSASVQITFNNIEKALERSQDELSEMKKYSRSNVATNLKDTIYHEAGHGIERARHLSMNTPADRKIQSEWMNRCIRASSKAYNSEWRYKISRYGSETSDVLGGQTVGGGRRKYSEFFAESFAAYMKGERSNIYPELLELFNEVTSSAL